MHEEYVEPSKQKADLIVHSTGHSIDVAIQMLTNHVRVVTGIVTPTVDAAAAATKLP
jgi:uridine kinase